MIRLTWVFAVSGETTSSLAISSLVRPFGDQHSDGNPDEDAIMATAQSLGVG